MECAGFGSVPVVCRLPGWSTAMVGPQPCPSDPPSPPFPPQMPGLVQSHTGVTREQRDPEVIAPAPTPAPVPAPGEDPLLTGYQDCAAEAVRFLVEEEGRSPDDPTVVGLTEHLQAR